MPGGRTGRPLYGTGRPDGAQSPDEPAARAAAFEAAPRAGFQAEPASSKAGMDELPSLDIDVGAG